jgi:hypothetical protein
MQATADAALCRDVRPPVSDMQPGTRNAIAARLHETRLCRSIEKLSRKPDAKKNNSCFQSFASFATLREIFSSGIRTSR